MRCFFAIFFCIFLCSSSSLDLPGETNPGLTGMSLFRFRRAITERNACTSASADASSRERGEVSGEGGAEKSSRGDVCGDDVADNEATLSNRSNEKLLLLAVDCPDLCSSDNFFSSPC